MRNRRKLKLNKHKIAAISNLQFIVGGADNSNAITICNETGDVSVTCITNCDFTCNGETNNPSVCEITNPGTTRPNTGVVLTSTCPPDLG
jgi:hypothetical protein